ncbi:MAG TPA: F0F1 ATP synthase subunit epsilon, partial [bacterium]|nr:F0F1 ATP synthase subunit epsilon [bacterium]
MERIVLHEDDVIQISLPTMSGEITILPNHVPMLSVISQGEMRIEQVAGGDISWFVSGGMVL